MKKESKKIKLEFLGSIIHGRRKQMFEIKEQLMKQSMPAQCYIMPLSLLKHMNDLPEESYSICGDSLIIYF